MTPQERLDYLLETVSVPSNRGRLTHAWVAENINLNVADGVYNAINDVSQPTALRYATGNGIDTSAELWKMQANAVAVTNGELAPHLELLRDFELDRKSRWQVDGLYGSEPTLEQIESEIAAAALAADQKQAREAIAEAVRQADAVRFAAEQDGKTGAECIADWLIKVTGDLS